MNKKEWKNSKDGAQLLKYAAERGVDRLILMRAACECARLAEHLMPADSVKALRVFERYSVGEASEEEFEEAKKLANTARSCATRATTYAATYTAYATATAAAATTAYATATHATATYTATAATSTAATYTKVRQDTLRKCAKIARSNVKFKMLGGEK